MSLASVHKPLALESLQAIAGFEEVVVYGPVPPVIVNEGFPPVALETETEGGSIRGSSDGFTITVVDPDFPPAVAVTVTGVSTVTIGAVNVVSTLPVPPDVWTNGGLITPAVEVKFTVVPSGTGLFRFVYAYAVILTVPLKQLPSCQQSRQRTYGHRVKEQADHAEGAILMLWH